MKGYQSTLADRLLPYIGYTPGIRMTAEALESAARSYSRIQERWCSEEMSEDTTARLPVTSAGSPPAHHAGG
jgi:hypothetical protein